MAATAPLGMPSGKNEHHPGWKPLQGSASDRIPSWAPSPCRLPGPVPTIGTVVHTTVMLYPLPQTTSLMRPLSQPLSQPLSHTAPGRASRRRRIPHSGAFHMLKYPHAPAFVLPLEILILNCARHLNRTRRPHTMSERRRHHADVHPRHHLPDT